MVQFEIDREDGSFEKERSTDFHFVALSQMGVHNTSRSGRVSTLQPAPPASRTPGIRPSIPQGRWRTGRKSSQAVVLVLATEQELIDQCAMPGRARIFCRLVAWQVEDQRNLVTRETDAERLDGS